MIFIDLRFGNEAVLRSELGVCRSCGQENVPIIEGTIYNDNKVPIFDCPIAICKDCIIDEFDKLMLKPEDLEGTDFHPVCSCEKCSCK